MSVGTQNIAIALDQAERRFTISVLPWRRKLLTITLTGHSPAAAGDIAIVGYIRNTLVVTASAFTGTSASATGTLDLDTDELATAFAGAVHGATRAIDLRIWNGNVSSLELLAYGPLPVHQVALAHASDVGSTPVTPVAASTIVWGNLALYNGVTYVKNNQDGWWYPFDLRGDGDSTHPETGSERVSDATINP